jgi:hypothetical protein
LQAIKQAETDLKAEPSAPDSAATTIEPATAPELSAQATPPKVSFRILYTEGVQLSTQTLGLLHRRKISTPKAVLQRRTLRLIEGHEMKGNLQKTRLG